MIPANEIQKLPAFDQRKGVAIQITDDQAWAALDGRRIDEAAELLGVNHKLFYRKFSHLLKKRKAERISSTPFPSVLGGSTWKTREGYIREFAPRHPNSTSDGSAFQHRIAMAVHLGRKIERDEVVHHKNGNRMDNRIENLELMKRLKHVRHHADELLLKLNEDVVKTALRGRTTLEAASVLGVNHQTLRNRFGSLLKKRKSPVDPRNVSTIELVRIAAADDQIGYRDFAKSTGISAQVAKQICTDNSIAWVPKIQSNHRKSIQSLT
jgi:hypothetical protein